ncbi:MAG: rhomboid family intramembrane serine protease [Sedimentisphaerales bacterium]|nr:rhomboid family intramembrane serine protease [Sedimentisphaerales bacterium]
MYCPVCRNVLRTVKSRGFVLDVCLTCKGIWFDDGELIGFAKALENEVEPVEKLTLYKPRKAVGQKELLSTRSCPRCNVTMKQFNYAYDSNIFLDRCLQCGGVWTDAGEIQRVAVHLKKDPRVQAIGESLVKSRSFKDIDSLSAALNSPMPYFFLAPRIILPLYDDTPRQRIPFVTLGLIVLCTVLFSLMMFGVCSSQACLEQFAFVPLNLFSIGLVTALFLHGGWLHLIGNMFYMWLFADNIEDRLGWFKFIFFYLAAGICANLFYAVFNLDSSTPLVGASGAIAGVMGAYMVYFPGAHIKTLMFFRIFDIPAWFYLGFWIVLQVINGILDAAGGASGVAWLAHIGGFLFGLLVAGIDKMISTMRSAHQAQ